MPFITWSPDFDLNVKSIDDQHRTLVDLINQLHDAMKEGKGSKLMSEVLKKLVDYTVWHFSMEEKYMIKHNYPGQLVHKGEHNRFIEKVSEFHNNYNNGKAVLSMEVMDFLKNWLVDHILKTDKKLGAFLAEQK